MKRPAVVGRKDKAPREIILKGAVIAPIMGFIKNIITDINTAATSKFSASPFIVNPTNNSWLM